MPDSTKNRENYNMKTVLSLTVGMSALLAVSGAPAIAQSDTEEDASRLSTIVVSATKRDTTLQEIPVAVSVVDETTIERASILDLSDLQSIVPSLQINQLQSSTNTNFIIRGFGNGANNAGIEPSVGVFIDGVYRSRSAAQIGDLPNLQRVEVLRGPQSTLFGKNASAGVISIVTRAPQFETQGNLEASYGNFNSRRLKGDITGPITDKLAYSLSGNINKRDGYAEDLASNELSNERDRWGVRGQLLFEPSENVSFRVIADHDVIDEICCVAANLIDGPTGAAIRAIGGDINGADPFSYQVFGNYPTTNNVENSGISLQADFDLGFASLTSISSYRTSDYRSDQDSDFTSADLISRNFNETNIETLTQEIRLTSNTDGKFDWMVGGYVFDESVAINNEFTYGADYRSYADILAGGPAAIAGTEAFIGVPIGTTLGASGQGNVEKFGQDDNALSFFGSLDYHLSDRLTASLGLNYTNTEKDAYASITGTDVLSSLDLVQLGYNAALAGGLGANGVDLANDPASAVAFITANPAIYAAIQQGSVAVAQDPTLNPFGGLAALQFLAPFLNYPNSVEDGKSSDSNTSYSLRLAYSLTDEINVYGSYATGFKASSWNLSRDSLPFAADFTPGSNIVDPLTGQVVATAPSSAIQDAGIATTNLSSGTRFASPEEAAVLEIGLKASFDRFALNLAIFDQTIEGFQSNVFTGTGFALANAGEQSTIGVEMDANWRPIDSLTLTFAGTFLDPIYESFPASAGGDISGTSPSGIPSISTSFGFNYDFEFENADSYIRADWQYVSDTDFFDSVDTAAGATDNNVLIAPGGYDRNQSIINLAAGVITDDNVGISIWARNVLNDQWVTTAFPSVAQAGSISGYPSLPRTYGITVRKSF